MKTSNRPRSGLWPLVGAAMLLASPASADNAVCPTKNRLHISSLPWGTIPGPLVVALGTKDGVMTLLMKGGDNACSTQPVKHDLDWGLKLTKLLPDANVWCAELPANHTVTDGVIVFEVVSTPKTYACAGGTQTLQPLNYNGQKLSIYVGDGNDDVYAGAGTDIVYGGAGGDYLVDNAGTGDRLFGEHSADFLYCSDGNTSWCDGGSGADFLSEIPTMNKDRLNGGSNSDYIWACGGRPEALWCGSNVDQVYWSDSTTPNDGQCEHIDPC